MSTRTPRSVSKQRRRTPSRTPAATKEAAASTVQQPAVEKASSPQVNSNKPRTIIQSSQKISGLQAAAVFGGALLLLLLAVGGLSVLFPAGEKDEDAVKEEAPRKPVIVVEQQQTRPVAETWALERNLLSLENGAVVLDMSPLPAPRASVMRNTAYQLSNMTVPFAFTSKLDHDEDKCWFLPPPTGSGQIRVKLKGCQKLSRFAYDLNGGVKDADPARISLWANGSLLAALEPLKHISTAHIDRYQPCADEIAIYVTGKGQGPGSCVRKLVLV